MLRLSKACSLEGALRWRAAGKFRTAYAAPCWQSAGGVHGKWENDPGDSDGMGSVSLCMRPFQPESPLALARATLHSRAVEVRGADQALAKAIFYVCAEPVDAVLARCTFIVVFRTRLSPCPSTSCGFQLRKIPDP